MPEVGGNKGRTIRRLRPGAPVRPLKCRPRQATAKAERPWYDGGPGTPALPGEPCRTPPHPDWSEAEKWAWERICKGEVADFNGESRCGSCPLPAVAEAWTEEEKERRGLSPKFLRTILTRKPWKESITEKGVCILGAHFAKKVDLENAEVGHELWLDNSWLGYGFEANDAQMMRNFSLRASFLGYVNLTRTNVLGALTLAGAKVEGETRLGGAKVGGQLSMKGATFVGPVSMSSLQAADGLFMDQGATFKGEIIMVSAQVAGVLTARGSTFESILNMDSLQVDNTLFMDQGATFEGKTILRGAKIGQQLAMVGSTFEGEMEMGELWVGSSLFMRGATYKKLVDIDFATISGQLLLEGAEFVALDLTGTRAGTIICTRENWPADIKLDRFTYSHLGGMGKEYAGDHMTSWPASWFIKWLAKQKEYTPQPYEQCAKVLREAGQPGKANRVLFAGKVRERKEAWKQAVQIGRGVKERMRGLANWAWLWALQATIGYGLGWRYWFSLGWVVPFTLFGAWVASTTPLAAEHTWGWMLGYSFSKLIPLVSLGKNFEAVVHGWQQGYFIGHQMLGWALASFIVAGLAGLTKKS